MGLWGGFRTAGQQLWCCFVLCFGCSISVHSRAEVFLDLGSAMPCVHFRLVASDPKPFLYSCAPLPRPGHLWRRPLLPSPLNTSLVRFLRDGETCAKKVWGKWRGVSPWPDTPMGLAWRSVKRRRRLLVRDPTNGLGFAQSRCVALRLFADQCGREKG